jgi:hypothetical protein
MTFPREYGPTAAGSLLECMAEIGLDEIASSIHSLSKIAQAPIPVPMHMETTPNFLLVLLSSWKSVTIILAPVIPTGWPRAIAPPLGLSFSRGMDNFSIV